MTLIKLKFYLLSSTNMEEQQDQIQLPAKEKKDGSLLGYSTYATGITTERKPYSGNIKPSKFCKRLDQANQSFKQKCDG